MGFMSWIINELNDVSDYFYDAYLEVNGWVWPFWELGTPFYYLCLVFNSIAWDFYDFSNWVDNVSSKIGDYLSWSTIQSYILSWFHYLGNISDVFYYFRDNVLTHVSTWWSATQYTVKGWIDAAVQGLENIAEAWSNFWNYLWPQLSQSFNNLQSSWDNFWSYTLPGLVDFGGLWDWWDSRIMDVQDLITTATREIAGLSEGWLDMRANVVQFFTDPVEYIWERFTDWFLGPEV